MKNWFFAHGGRLDLETGKLIHGPKLERATQRFSYALQAKVIGAFRPNREKDEPTCAIGTAEHSGRTKGLGQNISWEHGFPNDRDTYRVRNQHYFRGDDVIHVEFLELHQLCHWTLSTKVSLAAIVCKCDYFLLLKCVYIKLHVYIYIIYPYTIFIYADMR